MRQGELTSSVQLRLGVDDATHHVEAFEQWIELREVAELGEMPQTSRLVSFADHHIEHRSDVDAHEARLPRVLVEAVEPDAALKMGLREASALGAEDLAHHLVLKLLLVDEGVRLGLEHDLLEVRPRGVQPRQVVAMDLFVRRCRGLPAPFRLGVTV